MSNGDLISREEALETLRYLTDFVCDKEYEEGKVLLFQDSALERIAELEPAQRWIPCSERQPKKDGRYQVTRHDYVTKTEFIDILWYEKNMWWDRRRMGNYAVIAWMPLPEPYKEENDNERHQSTY